MKFLIFCTFLPLTLCLASESISKLLDKSKIEKDFERLLQIIGGSDLTRQACEHECHKYAKGDEAMYLGCPFACAGLQETLKKWGHSKGDSLSKRMILDTLFDLPSLKADLQIMLDVLGSDPTESACENECHYLLKTGHVFHYGCDFACHGFQSLIHMLHIKPDPTIAGTTLATTQSG